MGDPLDEQRNIVAHDTVPEIVVNCADNLAHPLGGHAGKGPPQPINGLLD
jgi:hypothetical protein